MGLVEFINVKLERSRNAYCPAKKRQFQENLFLYNFISECPNFLVHLPDQPKQKPAHFLAAVLVNQNAIKPRYFVRELNTF